MVVAPSFRVFVADTVTGAIVGWLAPMSLTCGPRLNAAGALDVKITRTNALGMRSFDDVTKPLKRSLGIAFGDNIIDAGPIYRRIDDPSSDSIQIYAKNIFSIFDRRLIFAGTGEFGANDKPTTNVLNIDHMSVKDINNYLVGNNIHGNAKAILPINVPAAVANSGTASRSYFGYDLMSIGTAISQNAQAGGPDVVMRPRFKDASQTAIVWDMISGDPLVRQSGPDWVFDAAASKSAVTEFTVDEDASTLSSRAWVSGNGTGTSMELAFSESTTLTNDGFPFTETTAAAKSVTSGADLALQSNELLQRSDEIWQTWSIKLRADSSNMLGTYREGDWVQFNAGNSHPLVDPGMYRTRVMAYDVDGSMDVSVTLAPVKGDAYNVANAPRRYVEPVSINNLANTIGQMQGNVAALQTYTPQSSSYLNSSGAGLTIGPNGLNSIGANGLSTPVIGPDGSLAGGSGGGGQEATVQSYDDTNRQVVVQYTGSTTNTTVKNAVHDAIPAPGDICVVIPNATAGGGLPLMVQIEKNGAQGTVDVFGPFGVSPSYPIDASGAGRSLAYGRAFVDIDMAFGYSNDLIVIDAETGYNMYSPTSGMRIQVTPPSGYTYVANSIHIYNKIAFAWFSDATSHPQLFQWNKATKGWDSLGGLPATPDSHQGGAGDWTNSSISINELYAQPTVVTVVFPDTSYQIRDVLGHWYSVIDVTVWAWDTNLSAWSKQTVTCQSGQYAQGSATAPTYSQTGMMGRASFVRRSDKHVFFNLSSSPMSGTGNWDNFYYMDFVAGASSLSSVAMPNSSVGGVNAYLSVNGISLTPEGIRCKPDGELYTAVAGGSSDSLLIRRKLSSSGPESYIYYPGNTDNTTPTGSAYAQWNYADPEQYWVCSGIMSSVGSSRYASRGALWEINVFNSTSTFAVKADSTVMTGDNYAKVAIPVQLSDGTVVANFDNGNQSSVNGQSPTHKVYRQSW